MAGTPSRSRGRSVEAATTRIGVLMKYLRNSKTTAVAEVGLVGAEYDTLHLLMIRDTPGHASPTGLAHDLGLSPAGMTGRLDALEAKGYLRRVRDDDDRRRVDIEVTTTGFALWQKAMRMRGHSEDSVFAALTTTELHTLNRLLKKLTLAAGDPFMTHPVPVVLDVDTGVDDACALLLAAPAPRPRPAGGDLRRRQRPGGRRRRATPSSCSRRRARRRARWRRGATRPLLEDAGRRPARARRGRHGRPRAGPRALTPDPRHAVELLRDVRRRGGRAEGRR